MQYGPVGHQRYESGGAQRYESGGFNSPFQSAKRGHLVPLVLNTQESRKIALYTPLRGESARRSLQIQTFTISPEKMI